MTHAQRSILPVLILAVAAPLRAADRQVIASLLEKVYKGQKMVLRTYNSGANVRYSPDGRLIKGGKPGPWTLDATLQCSGVEVKGNDLVVKGKRLYFMRDEALESLRPYLGPRVRIEIDIRGYPLSLSTLQQAIANVFVPDTENSKLLVPDYWKDYMLRRAQEAIKRTQKNASANPPGSTTKLTGKSNKQTASGSPIFRVGALVNPKEKRRVPMPMATHVPEPPYTPQARMAGLEGTVILSVVIDATGHVSQESIIKALGMGLDDNAANTVQKWRFKPSMVDGKPVAVRTLVEITFRYH
jgi:TonB family protein